MTKERKIEILKDLLIQLSDSANILCTCEADERCDVIEEYIKALEQNTVSQETYDSEYLARKQAEQKLYEIEQNTSNDCVSRQAVIDLINADWKYGGLESSIKELPPVTPTHGTCKDCKQLGVMDCGYYCKLNHWGKISTQSNYGGMGDFYCGDFERRE